MGIFPIILFFESWISRCFPLFIAPWSVPLCQVIACSRQEALRSSCTLPSSSSCSGSDIYGSPAISLLFWETKLFQLSKIVPIMAVEVLSFPSLKSHKHRSCSSLVFTRSALWHILQSYGDKDATALLLTSLSPCLCYTEVIPHMFSWRDYQYLLSVGPRVESITPMFSKLKIAPKPLTLTAPKTPSPFGS